MIAAGGGGSSSRLGHSMPPDGRGLINPWENLDEWKKLVSKRDTDAGNLLPPYTEKNIVPDITEECIKMLGIEISSKSHFCCPLSYEDE